MASTKKKPKKQTQALGFPIVLDVEKNLIFNNEKEIRAYLGSSIENYLKIFESSRSKDDTVESEVDSPSDEIMESLQNPDKVLMADSDKIPIFTFTRWIENYKAHHLVVCVLDDSDSPAYILFNGFTREIKVLEKFSENCEVVYHKDFEAIEFASLDGDALNELDPLAMGLFQAVLKIRQNNDIAKKHYRKLGEELREIAIQSPDEIWRSLDHKGHILVTFIKEFPDHSIRDLHYIAITLEDPISAVHSLLFSFPTKDLSLVERYRHGENLQAEEVNQESPH